MPKVMRDKHRALPWVTYMYVQLQLRMGLFVIGIVLPHKYDNRPMRRFKGCYIAIPILSTSHFEIILSSDTYAIVPRHPLLPVYSDIRLLGLKFYIVKASKNPPQVIILSFRSDNCHGQYANALERGRRKLEMRPCMA